MLKLWLITIYISSHMYLMLLLVTHTTQVILLLNSVHEIVCEFGLAIKDFDTKYVHCLSFGDKSVKILFLEDLGWIQVLLENF